MGKVYEIFPGFSVTPGEISLRVCAREFLDRFVPNRENYGAGFSNDRADRYSGKKLKLHHVRKLKDGPSGAKWHFYFSADSDTYVWNEYMFEEFWVAGGKIDYIAPKKAPVKEEVLTRKVVDEISPEPICLSFKEPEVKKEEVRITKSSGKSNMNKMIKMMILMNLLNNQKT